MKILVVGSGGREHALAWRLKQSPGVTALFASPGNPGIAQLATCLPAPDAVTGFADLAEANGIDLTVVGPEAPLVAGIVDEFFRRGLKIVGPTQAAAQLEGSKLFAKEFLRRTGIPTAQVRSSLSEARYPVVIKADGLAAGKGVVIAQDRLEAEAALARFGESALIEEHLVGEEVSFIGLSNGKTLAPFAPTQDHKRAFDGDLGPNTGGMGAYADSRILTPAQTSDILDRIMLPAVHGMAKAGTPFTGFLYAGLMMTSEGPMVLEFNARLGDPETQTLMTTYDGDLAELLWASVNDVALPPVAPIGSCSACIILAAQGYPEQPQTGEVISGIREAESTGAIVFQAGTASRNGQLVTSGGRVLGVTARRELLQDAIAAAYAGVNKLHFEGMQYRRDIGQKGLRRW